MYSMQSKRPIVKADVDLSFSELFCFLKSVRFWVCSLNWMFWMAGVSDHVSMQWRTPWLLPCQMGKKQGKDKEQLIKNGLNWVFLNLFNKIYNFALLYVRVPCFGDHNHDLKLHQVLNHGIYMKPFGRWKCIIEEKHSKNKLSRRIWKPISTFN